MKRRNFLVSNSSSSSFIVIGNTGIYDNLRPTEFDDTYVIGENGEAEFGWTPVDIQDIDSRINFCHLQSKYLAGKYDAMIESVIKGNSKIKHIHSILTDDYYSDISIDNDPPRYKTKWGYIDHQSAAIEGQNLEMFESESTLEKFIFDSGSYIHTDNDNH